MFNTIHIVSLIVSAILVVVLTVLLQKISFEKVTKLMLFVGILAELIKVFAYTIMNENRLYGYLPKTDLPLHLCSFQVIFLLVLVLSKNENHKRIIRSFMLPTCLFGGLAALLIPISSAVNHVNIITFEYFGYHAAIMIFALRMLCGRDIKFTVRDYGTCLLLLFVVMFAAMYMNSILYSGHSDTNFIYEVTDGTHTGTVQLANVNFMYTVAPPADGLPLLNLKHGWGVYIVHYMFVCLFAITAVYSRSIITAIRTKVKNRRNCLKTQKA